MLEPSVRQLCAYATLALFVVFFFSTGLSYHYDPISSAGMARISQKLLDKISYNPSSDVLVHVGDFLTKAPHVESIETLSFMASHNITGVRGNHDQQVIEWRAWIHWIRTQPGGPRWLEETYTKWASAESRGEQDPEDWLEDRKRRDKDSKWWKKIPKGWVLFGAHFAIAQDMSEAHYAYLRSLPYIIHIPSAHTFIVHGGLLASNPKLGYKHAKQPLAHVPRLPKSCKDDKDKANITVMLRTMQEQEVLTQIPQNTIPFNVLNIRSLVKEEVTKRTGGKPWSKLWKQNMLRCAGFNGELNNVSLTKTEKLLPCYPATVVYGHAARRGLDVKRWSIGLDSGCVYERRLTALVLGGKNAAVSDRSSDDDDDDDDEQYTDFDEDEGGGVVETSADMVKFGDSHHGKIVSVRCR
ncbi:hypothetical protein DXG01_002224 [Tephrocybe rancida]|nr:hypothetical protein DXG01_002224 [Tephrocybe rancida]